MKPTISGAGVLTAVALQVSACGSLSTMQTASTVPAGALQAFGAAHAIDGFGFHPAPVFEGGVRYGLNDGLDVGAKLWLFSGLGLDAKLQLLRAGPFIASVDPGLTWMPFGGGPTRTKYNCYPDSPSDCDANSFFQLHLPLLLGLRAADGYEIVTAARASAFLFGPKGGGYFGRGDFGPALVTAITGSLGVALPVGRTNNGTDIVLFPEVNVSRLFNVPKSDLYGGTMIIQGGLGVMFTLPPSTNHPPPVGL